MMRENILFPRLPMPFGVGGKSGERSGSLPSAAKFQPLDDFLVFFQILTFQVVEQLTSLAGHFDEAVPGVKILAMGTQVFSKMRDSGCKQGNLHLARSCIFLVRSIFCDYSFFFRGIAFFVLSCP